MKNQKLKIKYQNQDGITLVLSLVLLASITFISFVLSTIIIREITISRSVLKTEPAISAASAGGELALYNFLRQTGTVETDETDLPSGQASYRVDSQLYEFPFIFSLQTPGSPNPQSFYLYDAANFENKRNLYGSVTVRNTTTGSRNPTFFEVRIYPFDNPDNSICFKIVSRGGSETCPLNQPDDRYIVEIKWGGGDITGEILAYDESNEPKGVPSDNPNLEVTGTKDEVQRKIRIELD